MTMFDGDIPDDPKDKRIRALAAELASEKQQLDNALSFYPARIRDLEARIDHLRTVANTSGVRSEDMASAIYRVLSSSPMETPAKLMPCWCPYCGEPHRPAVRETKDG